MCIFYLNLYASFTEKVSTQNLYIKFATRMCIFEMHLKKTFLLEFICYFHCKSDVSTQNL